MRTTEYSEIKKKANTKKNTTIRNLKGSVFIRTEEDVSETSMNARSTGSLHNGVRRRDV
jgi:hypothetical protein